MPTNRFGDEEVVSGAVNRFGDTLVQEEEGPLTTFGKNVLGVGEGLLSFGSGMLAAPAMGLRALGEWGLTDADMPTALARSQSSADALIYEPRTAAGKDAADMFSHAYEYGREKVGDIGGDSALGRTTAEVGFDLFALPAGIKGIGLSRRAGRGLRADASRPLGPSELGEAPKGKVDVSAEVMDTKIEPKGKVIHFDENGMPIEPSINRFGDIEITDRAEPRIGETRTPEEIAAEKASAEEGLAGIEQKELFDYESPYLSKDRPLVVDENGIPFDPERTAEVGTDVAGAQGDLFTPRTPYEGPEAGRPRTTAPLDYTKEVPSRINLETGRKIPRTKQDIKEFRERGPLEFQGERIEPTGIDYWTSLLEDLNLPTEKAVRNRTLQSLIKRSEEQRNYIESQLESRKSVEEVRKNITEFEEIQDRIHQKMDEIYSGELTRKIHPLGKKQSGQINPEVFKEGFRKVKEITEKGISLVAKGGMEGLRVEVIDNKGVRLGGAFFDKKTVLPDTFTGKEPLTEYQSLFSRGTGITESAQGKGLATDIYKFVAELGNDIVPSFSRTSKGRKMWEGFEKRGISSQGKINRQRGAVDLFSKKDKPTSKAVEKIREHLVTDTRSAKEFVAEEAKNVSEWQDIGDTWTQGFPASSVAAIARKSPAVKWLVDRVTKHDREARMAKENAKYGAVMAPKRGDKSGKQARMRSDDGALTIFEKLPTEQTGTGLRTWLEHFDDKMDPTPELLKARGLNEQQIKAVMAAHTQIKDFTRKYDKIATETGKFEPLNLRPGYFPHLWVGDYRVVVRDHKGKTVEVYGATNKHEATTITKDLQSKYPEYTIEPVEAKSRYDINDTSAFREAIGSLDKKDPARAELQKAYNDILAHRGFRKSTLFRGGAGGFLGTAEGKAGVKDGLHAIELYLDRGYNFLANQKKRADFAEFLEGMKEKKIDFARQFENTYEFMGDFIDHSAGSLKNGMQAIDSFVELLGRKGGELGLPTSKSTGRNIISTFNGAASAYWLSTPRFIFAQIVQPLYNLPKGFQLKADALTNDSVLKTFVESMYETYGKMSPETAEGLNWARSNGFIDSKMLDLMNVKYDKPYSVVPKALNTISKGTLGMVEQFAVRTPSFIFYDKLLRETVKDKEKRWEMAGILSDTYMVNYTVADRPMMYARIGMAGDAIVPLKQFQHAYYGQLLEYASRMKDEKQVKPLLAFLGVQAGMAGLKGFLGFAEATLIITAINSVLGTQIPTPEEFLATSGLSNALVFGGVSTLTGIDFSGTLGSPNLEALLSASGLSFGSKMLSTVGAYLLALSKGQETSSDKMKAALAVAPNIAHGTIEEAFTKPGEGPPNPNNKMRPDVGPRTGGIVQPDNPLYLSDKASRYMGGTSTKEAREKLSIRALKRKELQRTEQRGRLLEVMIDRKANKEKIDKEIIKKWIDLGGNPKQVDDAIVRGIKARAQTYAERLINTKDNWSVAQKAQRLKEFNLLLENTTDEEELIGIMKGAQNAR